MSEAQYFTQKGLDELKEEVNELKNIQRPKIIQAIACIIKDVIKAINNSIISNNVIA